MVKRIMLIAALGTERYYMVQYNVLSLGTEL